MKRFGLALAAVVFTLAGGPARAQTPPLGAEGAPPALAKTGGRRRMWHERESFLGVGGQFGLAAPTGLLGVGVSRIARHGLGFEVGTGIGATGLQLALTARYHQPIRPSFAVFTGLGPSVGVRGAFLPFRIEHRDDVPVAKSSLYYVAWVNGEVGGEVRINGGVFIRTSVGLLVRLAENVAGLCAGVEAGAENNPPNDGCDPPHWVTGSEYARQRVGLFLSAGAGVVF
jgi:hypothetical protein